MVTAAILLTAGFIPGLLVVNVCTGGDTTIPWYEKSLYAAGVGYALVISGMLLLSYMPGPIERWHIIAFFAAVTLVLLSVPLYRRRRLKPTQRLTGFIVPLRGYLGRWRKDLANRQFAARVAAVVLIGVVVLLFRFSHLGYAEFQGDEAAVGLTAEDMIRGYENALFVRPKGPGEVLVPALIYRGSGTLREVQARLPFSIANSLAVMAVLLLGSRLISPLAGLVAASVVALDGYLIAFGRIMQYQSIVFLMVVLSILVLYRLVREPTNLSGLLTLAAIFSATGALAHYEAAFLTLPGIYLLWRLGRQTGFGRLIRAAAVPAVVGMSIFGLFYLPFVLKPTFRDTFWYLFGHRMGGAAVEQPLQNVVFRTTLYSSSYYLFFLIAVAVVAMARLYVRILPVWLWRTIAVVILAVGMLFLVRPEALAQFSPRLWGVALALLLSAAWSSPRVSQEERVIWLWFGATLIFAVFLTARPNTHVYSVFIPWALLAGLAVQQFYCDFRARFSARQVGFVGVTAAVSLAAVFGMYVYQLFIVNQPEVLRTWPENRPRGYWTPYDMPVEIAIFGFPLRNGWNSIAALYETGTLSGGFDTNVRPAVAEWYTRGRGPCARDNPEYYFLAYPVEPTLAEDRAEIRRQLQEKYQLAATIEVQGEPHLELFARRNDSGQILVIDDAAYSAIAHGNHIDDDYRRDGPIGPSERSLSADILFRNGMRLRGFELSQSSVRAGDEIEVTLYWQANRPILNDYRISVQVIDLTDLRKAGQREGEPGCDMYPTSSWIAGDLLSDRYRVPIAEDAMEGDYTLLVTVYSEDGQVEYLDDAGNAAGVAVPLAKIAVTS